MKKEFLKQCTVLNVEDDVKVLTKLNHALELVCKNVYSAENGLEALDIYNEKSLEIDVVVTDIRMPKMNGLELIKEIREKDEAQGIVVLSANSDSDTLIDIINLGVDNFILKPVMGHILYKRIEETYFKCFHESKLKEYTELLEESQREMFRINDEQAKLIRILEMKMKSTPPLKTRSLPSVEKATDFTQTEPAPVENTPSLVLSQKEELIDSDYYQCVLEDDAVEMQELEEVIDAKVSLLMLKAGFDEEKFRSVAASFYAYSSVLLNYSRFNDLSVGIRNLAETIENEQVPEQSQKHVLIYLESFVFTIKKWRGDFFDGLLENPNIYDNSMLSDMQMIVNTIRNDFQAADTDVELF